MFAKILIGLPAATALVIALPGLTAPAQARGHRAAHVNHGGAHLGGAHRSGAHQASKTQDGLPAWAESHVTPCRASAASPSIIGAVANGLSGTRAGAYRSGRLGSMGGSAAARGIDQNIASDYYDCN